MGDSNGQARESSPKNREGYIFIIKEKVRKGEEIAEARASERRE